MSSAYNHMFRRSISGDSSSESDNDVDNDSSSESDNNSSSESDNNSSSESDNNSSSESDNDSSSESDNNSSSESDNDYRWDRFSGKLIVKALPVEELILVFTTDSNNFDTYTTVTELEIMANRIYQLYEVIYYDKSKIDTGQYRNIIIAADKFIYKEGSYRQKYINNVKIIFNTSCDRYTQHINVGLESNKFIYQLESLEAIKYFSGCKYSIGLVMNLKLYRHSYNSGHISTAKFCLDKLPKLIQDINLARKYYTIRKLPGSIYYKRVIDISLRTFKTEASYSDIRNDNTIHLIDSSIHICYHNIRYDSIWVDLNIITSSHSQSPSPLSSHSQSPSPLSSLLVLANIHIDRKGYLVIDHGRVKSITVNKGECDICFNYEEIYNKKCRCSIKYCVKCIEQLPPRCTVCKEYL